MQFPSVSTVDYRQDNQEFLLLAHSAGAEIIAQMDGSRKTIDAKYFIGKGKAQAIADLVRAQSVQVAIFNHSLSPAQERNLEGLIQCRVLDRTGLILDIFAQRARSYEGKLQVELAQLRHLSTRLVRGWGHLERQRGGIGLRGPGETQLETDRRLIRGRIKSIRARLEKVRKQRAQSRRARQRARLKAFSLVGYTSAGKSTLFNRITESEVFVSDQLFATLDPTLRRLQLPEKGPVILADTVGFVRELPHDLVDAFRATLEETQEADVLLHVIDAANSHRRQYIDDVNAVLETMSADHITQLRVYNKIDLLDDEKPRIEYDQDGVPVSVWISALSGEGLDLLAKAMVACLPGEMITKVLQLRQDQGKLRAQFYALGAVLAEVLEEEGGWRLSVRLTKDDFDRLMKQS